MHNQTFHRASKTILSQHAQTRSFLLGKQFECQKFCARIRRTEMLTNCRQLNTISNLLITNCRRDNLSRSKSRHESSTLPFVHFFHFFFGNREPKMSLRRESFSFPWCCFHAICCFLYLNVVEVLEWKRAKRISTKTASLSLARRRLRFLWIRRILLLGCHGSSNS